MDDVKDDMRIKGVKKENGRRKHVPLSGIREL
jgi:hypothetical protein